MRRNRTVLPVSPSSAHRQLVVRRAGVASSVLGLLFGSLVFADTYPRQDGIDAQHYIFHIGLSDDSDEINGDASVDILFVKSGVTRVALDLASAAAGKGMNVLDVTSENQPLKYDHASDRLLITMPLAPAAGEHRVFRVQYRGIPASGLRIGTNKYGERTFFSANWPDLARQWLPMIDHPYDKATSEFIVTAPVKYQVIANGVLVEEIDLGNGLRLTHWKQSVPIASWLNAIGVAQFSSRHFGNAEGIPLQTWVYHQDRDNGIITFENPTSQAVEFYKNHIGPYPYEKLADVEAAGLNGGTEHATAIFYGERSVGPKPATNLVAHEIAHQWFGDSVTEKDWDDVWLSEGFATYFTLLDTEHYEGRDAFVAGLKRSRETVFRVEQALPGVAVRHDNLSDMSKVLNQLVYQKGGWFLHMLRTQIGTDVFWAGIQDYYRRYRDSNASTDDFRRVMEEHSHSRLKEFFDQWLNRPGSPVVNGSWLYDPATKQIRVELSQTQSGDAYRLPLEVGFTVPGEAQMNIQKIEFSQKQQSFEIQSEKAPVSVTLDPNTSVLMKAEFTPRK